ncbi:hypothetical protein [Butyricicoccus sp.]|uniref:hypothetical protein n=1 Tax=Butyricicoccus sp. TaxID=2049021 RepID=UPI003F13CB94
MELKTPLYETHVAEGGKIVPFAGYLLPVQYQTGVIKEHMAVRQAAGLFDVSHMGEIVFSGPTALATLNHLMTNDFTNMTIGRVRYSAMCNQEGGTIDDLVVYKFREDVYLVVVNAANRHKDYKHMIKNLLPETKAEDISDSVAQLALQGPNAPEILARLLPEDRIPKKYYTAEQVPMTTTFRPLSRPSPRRRNLLQHIRRIRRKSARVFCSLFLNTRPRCVS